MNHFARENWQRFSQSFFSNSPRSQIFQDPFYRFQSFAEATQAAQLGIRIDANRATIDDWLRLPGISIHQARLLAALTQSGVQMHDLEDLAAALNTSVERLSPLAPILQFCFYDSNSPDQIQRLNPNRATAQQLVHIPAVDLYLARQIVAERRAGAYRSLVDLQQRLRLSANLVERLLHYLIF